MVLCLSFYGPLVVLSWSCLAPFVCLHTFIRVLLQHSAGEETALEPYQQRSVRTAWMAAGVSPKTNTVLAIREKTSSFTKLVMRSQFCLSWSGRKRNISMSNIQYSWRFYALFSIFISPIQQNVWTIKLRYSIFISCITSIQYSYTETAENSIFFVFWKVIFNIPLPPPIWE